MDQLLADETVDDGGPEDVLWPLTDWQGTVRDVATYNASTDVTTIANHKVYEAFGKVYSESAPSVDTIFGYTARYFDDDTGLQWNLNRWYDPDVGRWLSEDPDGFTAGDPNLYRYVTNSPGMYTDPSGLEPPLRAGDVHRGGAGFWWDQPQADRDGRNAAQRELNAHTAGWRQRLLNTAAERGQQAAHVAIEAGWETTKQSIPPLKTMVESAESAYHTGQQAARVAQNARAAGYGLLGTVYLSGGVIAGNYCGVTNFSYMLPGSNADVVTGERMSDSECWLRGGVGTVQLGMTGYMFGRPLCGALSSGAPASAQVAGLRAPKVASNDILAAESRLQNKLAAWQRYKGNKSLAEWSRRYDQLQINRARSAWAESFGEPGARYATPYGTRVVDNAVATEIKSGYQCATKFNRRQIRARGSGSTPDIGQVFSEAWGVSCFPVQDLGCFWSLLDISRTACYTTPMARPVRIEFENAVYHVTARGNERKDIYRDDADRLCFLETLEEAVERFGVVIHAFCLMPNHYHLLLQTPRANLSDSAGWLQATYSIRFNCRHRRSGHLYQGRFKAHLIEADSYARHLIKYIHLNPVRPRDKRLPIPVKRRVELSRYRWSSHCAYAGVANTPPPNWLCTEWLSYFGRTRRAAQAEYGRQIAEMFGQVAVSPWKDLRGGLVLGSDTLWYKVCGLMAQADTDEEIRWSRRAGAQAVAEQVERLVAEQTDRRIAIWLNIRHGGRSTTQVAKEYGYRDSSGAYRVAQRLEARAKQDRELEEQLTSLRNQLSNVRS